MNKKIVFLGFPGSGKGTQSAMLVEQYDVFALSTGEVFRSVIKEGKGELADKIREYVHSGNLVPTELVFAVVKENLNEHKKSWLLDGFPRDLHQAELLDAYDKPTDIVLFDMDEETIFKRLTGRRLAKGSGKMYNIYLSPPKKEGVCDVSGEELIQREDDKPDIVSKRIEVYQKETQPLIRYYQGQGCLKTLNANQEVEKVFHDLKKLLGL